MSPQETVTLFPDATPEERALVLMRAGRVSADDMPFVAAHIDAAVIAERERCAAIAARYAKTVIQEADPGSYATGHYATGYRMAGENIASAIMREPERKEGWDA